MVCSKAQSWYPPLIRNFVVRLRPLLRLELPETVCCTLDWANSEVVGVGCTNGLPPYLYAFSCDRAKADLGCVAVFNVKDALAKGVTERMPRKTQACKIRY